MQQLDAPKNQAELRSFLGMANYSAQFIHNYAALATPLWELTRKNARWVWTTQHESVLRNKREATNNSTTKLL